MKRKLLLFIILFALNAVAPAQEKQQSALGSLVEAEREFCKTSVARGIREAFIANLADDSTLFRPHAVAGKKWMTEQPARPGLLTWEPIFADVSRAGDLGYTFGTAELKNEGSDKIEYSNYVRIWKKRAGAWKLVLDVMSPAPPPAAGSR